VSADTKEYKALYKQQGEIHSFVFEMQIEATVVECICLAWEFDLVKSWNKVPAHQSCTSDRSTLNIICSCGLFEGNFKGNFKGVSTSRVSPPGPLSISSGHVGCSNARAFPPTV
jgi:hypothetical protein